MPDHGLSDAQLRTIRAIVREAGAGITRVDLFGSRALGAHRPHSDIDLAVEGDVSEAQVDRLWTLFHESSLPVSVDVVSLRAGAAAAAPAH